ncbi:MULTISPECIES: DUF6913 domain-containing protein [Sanguibacteroides]|uniref:Uncharacterized protein n=1 Tax=Sanguibacteroides justesenii TaxID=1547597 RepID=A0A0C3RJS8_9PORP|nr:MULTISPECIES: hypothetical protein [Sanguibacteroides]KIO46544.1 hypothetical protein BA92_01325 [Sanguibacteroides justesenii]KIO47076.1 hypothetical protein IE90_03460 [Sanguibacteroides justesenii]PXZ43724.1 hypothetical protein DMB45_10380 [Sanguibacteroides justesenii]
MFKKIFRKWKRWNLKGKQMEFERKLSFHNFKTARSCMIFWVESDIPFDKVERLKNLLSEHMNVDALVFLEPGRPLPVIPKTFCVNEDCISYSGKFSDSKLKGCVENAYDLWIDLSLKPNVLPDYIVRNSRAKCKIGMGRSSFENDIIFEDVNDIDTFTERISRLLSKVN